MRKLLLLSMLLLSCGPEQRVGQNVTVDNGDLAKVIEKLSDKVAASPQPGMASATPKTSPSSPGSTAPTPAATSAPIVPVPVPTASAAVSVTTSTDFIIFETSIPEPATTVNYSDADIESAKEAWRKRYSACKNRPIAVLKMYFDALLLAPSNKLLSRELIKTVSFDINSNDVAEQPVNVVAADKGLNLRSLYRGTQKKNEFSFHDFGARALNVYRPSAPGELKDQPLDEKNLDVESKSPLAIFTLYSTDDEFLQNKITGTIQNIGGEFKVSARMINMFYLSISIFSKSQP